MGNMHRIIRVSRHAVYCIAAMWLLGSCAANLADTARLDGQDGIMVANIITNFDGKITVIDAQHTTLLAVSAGESFKFIRLHAGVHQWQEIRIGRGHCSLPEIARFAIWPHVMNYVGDLYIELDAKARKCWSRFFEDHSDLARMRIAMSYPRLSKTYKFVMSLTGGGEATVRAREVHAQAPNARALISRALAEVAVFRDRFCACRDRTCAGHVSAAMAEWRRTSGLGIDSSELQSDEQAKLDETMQGLDACKLCAAAPPAAEPSAATPGNP
jgi:hypothetical protein